MMMRFMNYGASVTGTKHIKMNKVNQDAFIYKDIDSGIQMMALSDGHGAPQHMYSDEGAKYAVEVALDAIGGYFEFCHGDITLSELKYDFEERLSIEIQTRWLNKIMQDPKFETPIQYGCTLLVAIRTNDYLIFLQIGDGKIAMVYEDGVVYFPMQRDLRYEGNVTASLVQENAWLEMKVKVLPIEKSLNMIILASDGVENAYPHGYYDDADFYLNLAKEQDLANNLVSHLQKAAYFSKDDTTVVIWKSVENQLLEIDPEQQNIWIDASPEDWIPLSNLVTNELHKRIEVGLKLVDFFDEQQDVLPAGATLKTFLYDQKENKFQFIPNSDMEKIGFVRIKKILSLVTGVQIECNNRADLKRTLIELQKKIRYDLKQSKFLIDKNDALLPVVSLSGANEKFEIFYNSEIRLHQIMPIVSQYDPIIGRIVQHPKRQAIWGIVNETGHTWEVYSQKYELIPPGKTVTLRSQMTVFINGIPVQFCIHYQ